MAVVIICIIIHWITNRFNNQSNLDMFVLVLDYFEKTFGTFSIYGESTQITLTLKSIYPS